MAGRRAERVSRQVVQALASIVETGVHDPRLAGITFTAATATDDLRTVRVYFTVFGDAPGDEAAADGLKAASGFLRRELAQRLSLRYVPSLLFEYDESVRNAERIARLLRERSGSAGGSEPGNEQDDEQDDEQDGPHRDDAPDDAREREGEKG
jgi:ribosome-binding factor A